MDGDLDEFIITEYAAQKMQEQCTKEGKPLEIRVGIQGGGCSGYSYLLEYKNRDWPKDTVYEFENSNMKVYVDPKSKILLKGIILEYEIINSFQQGFVFQDPQKTRQDCGCGVSFSLK